MEPEEEPGGAAVREVYEEVKWMLLFMLQKKPELKMAFMFLSAQMFFQGTFTDVYIVQVCILPVDFSCATIISKRETLRKIKCV